MIRMEGKRQPLSHDHCPDPVNPFLTNALMEDVI